MKPPFKINELDSTYITTRPVTADELISTARELIAARFTRGTMLIVQSIAVQAWEQTFAGPPL